MMFGLKVLEELKDIFFRGAQPGKRYALPPAALGAVVVIHGGSALAPAAPLLD